MHTLSVFNPAIRSAAAPGVVSFLTAFEEAATALHKMTGPLEVRFNPSEDDPRRLNNHYIELLLATYAAKYALLAEQLISGLNRFDLLAYGGSGRGLLEITATLRYYVLQRYKPLLDAGLTSSRLDLRQLLREHDLHLRGTRFDWELFAKGNMAAVIEAAAERLKSRKNAKSEANRIRTKQVNILTCIEAWAGQEEPVILVLYELLCDLVHPNLGSGLAAASLDVDGLVFGRVDQNVAAMNLFNHTFPYLVSACVKSFGRYFAALAAAKFQPNEL